MQETSIELNTIVQYKKSSKLSYISYINTNKTVVENSNNQPCWLLTMPISSR